MSEDDTRRWAKPAVVLDVVEGDALIQMPSGQTMIDVEIAVDEETLERMRQGYICANCMEAQEIPFPERCEAHKLPSGEVVGCFYPMRALQLRDLAERHNAGKEVHVGSRVKLYDEFERLREMNRYEERTGIVLPDSVKFPSQSIRRER